MRRSNLLCSSIALAMSYVPAHAMTLTEAIQSTVENHPQIQASQNARLSADEEVKVAKGGVSAKCRCARGLWPAELRHPQHSRRVPWHS